MREQRPGETIEEYITALRKLASTCKFGATVDERIRDQFMLRCLSDKVRQELWSKDDPPLHEVIVLAKRVEHTLACVEELEKGRSFAINKITARKENPIKEGDGVKGDEKVFVQEPEKVCGSFIVKGML
ncbi:hypothetical protein NDU88_001490 [Pleurodeles waltl]|uniref:Retrotransposon gag domain-containing protein n=1 Tax=Pleurodeles waltl TaxID=8319 RepID=A0AAV7UTH7_PLEWA|nr:hypothetical protein NDU88_001490 [Pleurodeles waltl]